MTDKISMGLNSEIIAIGQFSEAVATHLEYSSEHYSNTKKGSMIINTTFFIESARRAHKALPSCAECFPNGGWWRKKTRLIRPTRASRAPRV